jgi:hypothetical protein
VETALPSCGDGQATLLPPSRCAQWLDRETAAALGFRTAWPINLADSVLPLESQLTGEGGQRMSHAERIGINDVDEHVSFVVLDDDLVVFLFKVAHY